MALDPTGVADSAPTLQALIDAALAAGTPTLTIPTGTYLLHAMATATEVIRCTNDFSVPARKTLAFATSGGPVTFTTDQYIDTIGDATMVSMFQFYGAFTVTFDGFTFVNTHPAIAGDTIGIYFEGGSGNDQANHVVRNGTFRGFSRSILASGVVSPLFELNAFESPKGHDSGTTNTRPNVGIFLVSGAGGQVVTPTIQDNTWNGYTGVGGIVADAPTTKACLDGFVWGACDGATIRRNVIRNVGAEGVYCRPYAASVLPVVIEDNTVHAAIPTSALVIGTVGAQAHNYGIRSDARYSEIRRNVIDEATAGILGYTFDQPGVSLASFLAEDNVVTLPVAPSVAKPFLYGIHVSANAIDRSTGITLRRNQVVGDPAAALASTVGTISAYRCDGVEISDNAVPYMAASQVLASSCTAAITTGNTSPSLTHRRVAARRRRR